MDFMKPLNCIPPLKQLKQQRPTPQRQRYNCLEELSLRYHIKQHIIDTPRRPSHRNLLLQRHSIVLKLFIMIGLSSLVLTTVHTFRLVLPTIRNQPKRYINVPKVDLTSIISSRYNRIVQRHISEAVSNDAPTLDDNNVPPPILDQEQPQISYQLIQDIAASTKIEAREKRKKLLRVAKAIDRGLPNVTTYNPCVIIPPSSNQSSNNDIDASVTTRPIVSYASKSGLPDRSKLFTVLGIESSCDDTGVAIVRSDGIILGEALVKQNEIHEQWGGVVPGLARDAHVKVIDSVVETALRNANLTSIQNDIDAIAVTVGPGLEICLRVGCQKAISLAEQYDKPFVGVHHLEAHILMARIPTQPQSVTTVATSNILNDDLVRYPATADIHENFRTVAFPFLAMLVSGGHCQLIKCIGIGQYEILGGTLDDSLGEAYDKVARLLGLPVGGGGGPAVERLAKKGNPKAIPFTLPMQTSNSLDFSYAGLKTNVRRACEGMVQKHNEEIQHSSNTTIDNVEGTADVTSTTTTPTFIQSPDQLPEEVKADIAASFQHIAIRHIEEKLKRAMTAWEKHYDASNYNDHRLLRTTNDEDNNDGKLPIPQYTLALVGGVAANQELRTRIEALCQKRSKPWKMLVPPPRLCTDQGAYVLIFCLFKDFVSILSLTNIVLYHFFPENWIITLV